MIRVSFDVREASELLMNCEQLHACSYTTLSCFIERTKWSLPVPTAAVQQSPITSTSSSALLANVSLFMDSQ